MSRRLLTEEIYQNMYRDHENGFSLVELCEKYGFKKVTIQKHFHQRGVYFSKARRFSNEELGHIVNDYKNGMRPYELAKKYNRDSGTIIGKLQDIGVYEFATHHFTDEEIEFLKIYYPIGDWDAIREFMPNVSLPSIYTKMHDLGISMDSFFWNEDDIKLLKSTYESMFGRIRELVDLFNGKFTYKAIVSKARKIGLKTREFWDDAEIMILKEHYHLKTLDEMMTLLPDRNRESIINKARELGLKNCCKYQDEETQFIIDNWNEMSDMEMAQTLNREIRSVMCKRQNLGLLRLKEEASYNNLSEYVRRNNNEWKTASMINCKYKCVLTGNRFDDIHHIYSLNLILNETLEELHIDVKESMDDYTDKELKDILYVFRRKQNEYPLGVCLCKDVHTLFHNKYGYGYNTKEQWNKFVKDFKNNKYQINVA